MLYGRIKRQHRKRPRQEIDKGRAENMANYKKIKDLATGDSVNNCKVFANDGGLIIYTNQQGIYEYADLRPFADKNIRVD